MTYKVYLVDDDRFIRKGLISLIDWNSCGFEVYAEADNGEDALEFIKNNKIDLVVTDIRMPVLNGLDLIKQTVETMDLAPNFIIMSGYSDFSYAQKALKFGVHDFILKPVDKEEIENTLKELAKKIEKEKVLQKNREESIAINILNEMLTGNEQPISDRILKKKMNIEDSEVMCYLIVEVNNVNVNVNLLRKMVRDTIVAHKFEKDSILIRVHDQYSLGILVKSKELLASEYEFEQFTKSLQQQVSQKLGEVISIYVGNKVDQVSEIKKSFEAAKIASEFKYAKHETQPIFYQKLKDKSVNYINFDQSLLDLLMVQLEEHDTNLITMTIDNILIEFKNKLFSRDAVKSSLSRVVHEVMKTIRSLGENEQELSSLESMLHLNESPHTLSQIKLVFTAFIFDAAELIAQINKKSCKSDIQKVKDYIDNHYQEQLTLKTIANKFYMNPVYMGQLFKKTYGFYFKDYYLQVRVNEAKRILRQTDMRVYEVAESVGFANVDYFVTKFEKTAGITPTKYRKKVLNMANK